MYSSTLKKNSYKLRNHNKVNSDDSSTMRITKPLLTTVLSALPSISSAYLYTHQKIDLLINEGSGINHLTTCISIPPIWTIHIQEAPYNKPPPRDFQTLCYNDGYSPLTVVVCQVTRPPTKPQRRQTSFKAVYCVPKSPENEIVSIDDYVALASQLRKPFGDDGSGCIPEPTRLLRWLQNDESGDSYHGEDYEIKQQRKIDEFHKILDTVRIPPLEQEEEEEKDGNDPWEPETPQTPLEMHNFADRRLMRKISGIDHEHDHGSGNMKSARGRSVAASLFNVIEDVNEPSSRGSGSPPPDLRRSSPSEIGDARSDNVIVVKSGGKNRWIACIGRVCGYFDPRKLRRGDGAGKGVKGKVVPNNDITPALDAAREHM